MVLEMNIVALDIMCSLSAVTPSTDVIILCGSGESYWEEVVPARLMEHSLE